MHLTDNEIAAKISLAGDEYGGVYRFLSTHAHGTPFATVSQSNTRGRGFDNNSERSYLNLLLPLVNLYMAKLLETQINLLGLGHQCQRELELSRMVLAKR
jgi:hypothetical protein